jgi:cytochrome d ubiquinol oxidase subunit I
VPELGSLILTHSSDGVVPGLTQWPKDQRAPVIFPFFAFRIMVGLGLLMVALVITALVLRGGGRLYRTKWFLIVCEWMGASGFLAVLAGWTTTETGRQPWTVYGLMRTADSVSPSLTTADVALSLAGYMVVYLIMFPAGVMLMARVVNKGFGEQAAEDKVGGGRPRNPVIPIPETPS